jgi:hypothetical protein
MLYRMILILCLLSLVFVVWLASVDRLQEVDAAQERNRLWHVMRPSIRGLGRCDGLKTC